MLTIYFFPFYTACFTYTRYLRASILLYTQYFEVRYWLYCMLKACKQKQQTTPTRWYPRIAVFFSPSLSISPFSAFSLQFGSIVSLSEFGTFRAVSFEWHADARCWSYGVQMLIFFSFSVFLFFLYFFFYFILRQNCWSYSMSDAIVHNCSTVIRTVHWSMVYGAVLTKHGSVSLRLY